MKKSTITAIAITASILAVILIIWIISIKKESVEIEESVKGHVEYKINETKEELEEEIEETNKNIKDTNDELNKVKEKVKDKIKSSELGSNVDNASQNTKPAPPISDKEEAANAYINKVEVEIVKLVNMARTENKIAVLTNDATCQRYAKEKSKDMAIRKYFAHENPEGKTTSDIMKSHGVPFVAWGENIAYISDKDVPADALAAKFMNKWMKSEDHKKNILNTTFLEIGVGVYKCNDTYFATQIFMR